MARCQFMNSLESTPSKPAAGTFPNTRWSMVVNANADSTAGAQEALAELCGLYWYPLYAFARRQGRNHHEAEDCTQTFLAQILANEGIARARPERGRFRSFLLTAMRNFLVNEWQKARAEKRGGAQVPLPLEFSTAEQTFSREPADPGLTPEQAFDRNWATGMIARAIAAVSGEYEKSGRGEIFSVLGPLVWGNDQAESFAAPAARLKMNTQAFSVALHRLRRRIGDRLRSEVAETVAASADVDEELRHLVSVASQGS